MNALAHRIHRLAVFAAWMSTAFGVTMALMVWLVNTDWFILLLARGNDSFDSPYIINQYCPMLILITGFVAIIAAMCGGFRREEHRG